MLAGPRDCMAGDRLASLLEEACERQGALFESLCWPRIEESSPHAKSLRNKVIDIIYSQHP
jgi:hypothetical protein